MSGYRLIPTFRLARRIAQDFHPYSMRPMFSNHWKHTMDHHLGMMEKMFDNVNDSLSKPMSCRRWSEEHAPSWWQRLDSDCWPQQTTSKNSRSFGRMEFGEDAKKFELVLDLGEQYKPDDVKVNVKLVNENQLHVEATIESGSAESGGYHKQYFSKVISMPEEANVEALKSTLSEDGMLKVEAPMMMKEEPQTSPVREIPIERTSVASSPEAQAETTEPVEK